MTRPADYTLRLTVAGLAAAAMLECATGVATFWVLVATVRPLIGAVGQWCLSRGLEEDSQ